MLSFLNRSKPAPCAADPSAAVLQTLVADRVAERAALSAELHTIDAAVLAAEDRLRLTSLTSTSSDRAAAKASIRQKIDRRADIVERLHDIEAELEQAEAVRVRLRHAADVEAASRLRAELQARVLDTDAALAALLATVGPLRNVAAIAAERFDGSEDGRAKYVGGNLGLPTALLAFGGAFTEDGSCDVAIQRLEDWRSDLRRACADGLL